MLAASNSGDGIWSRGAEYKYNCSTHSQALLNCGLVFTASKTTLKPNDQKTDHLNKHQPEDRSVTRWIQYLGGINLGCLLSF